MENKFNDTKKVVLEQIHNGEVLMRPRWHFFLKASLAITGIALTFLTLIYLMSFTLFALRFSGLLFVPFFGFEGFLILLASSPWPLIILTILFLFLFQLLVRKYAFGYRKPLLYTFLVLVVLAAIGSALLSPIHKHAVERIRSGEHAFVSSMYKKYGSQLSEMVYPGKIIEITENGFGMEDRWGNRHTVVLDESTFTHEWGPIAIDQYVLVMAERIDETTLRALGVRSIPNDMPPGGGPLRPRK